MLLEKVLKVGKPVIVILGCGSALSLNNLEEKCDAIINAWYPGSHGGQAIANILFGKCSPSGKLPITFYRNTDNIPEFTDYSMKNRTYRYMEEESLYSFGYGLTYSKVKIDNLFVADFTKDSEVVEVKVNISNIGDYDIEEVVQCYLKVLESEYTVKNHSLVAFKRIRLKKDESKEVIMKISKKSFEVVNYDGVRIMDSNKFKLYVGISQPDKRSVGLLNMSPLEVDIELV